MSRNYIDLDTMALICQRPDKYRIRLLLSA